VELRKAVRSFERDGVDAVFVDSAGRNQRDEMKMAELKEFLQVLPGVEVHLVLSTTTQPKTMKNVVERFDELKFHRVILTKLDETASFGAVLEALVVLGRPISFLTDGQNVPDDLMISDPGRLADMVLRPNNG
jgi:flagellar biosynthesis protein FlhF